MRYLLLIAFTCLGLVLNAQNWLEDFESGDLNGWNQIVGIADLVNTPKVEGNSSLRLWNFQERDNAEAILIHKTFLDDFGVYSYYARGDGNASAADFYFQYQDDNNYYHVSHKPEGTEDSEFVVSKIIKGVYTELYRQEAVEVREKWVYISIERTCAGRMSVNYNNNNVLDIYETDILDQGTIGLRTWSEFSYFDRIEFEPFVTEVSEIEAELCNGQTYKVGDKTFNSSGSYRDTLKGLLGCDSVVQLDLYFVDSIIVKIDTIICPGQSIIFDDAMIGETGTYTAKFLTTDGCDSIASWNVTSSPIFSLGPDRSSCDDEQILISASSQNSYLWSTGDISADLLVESGRSYHVEISDINNCIQRDTINIVSQCELKLYAPNVFSPNADSVNDIWKPEFDILPNKYALSVIDRWGNLLFESDDPNQSWDGKFKNKDVVSGVYFWYANADSQLFSGDVMVIR